MEDSQGLLRKVKEHPILLNEISARDAKITNLEETIRMKDTLLGIEEERLKLWQEKVDFYQKVAEAERGLVDRYAEMNQKLEKKMERQEFWGTVKSVLMGVAGIFVGLAF